MIDSNYVQEYTMFGKGKRLCALPLRVCIPFGNPLEILAYIGGSKLCPHALMKKKKLESLPAKNIIFYYKHIKPPKTPW